MSNQDYYGDAPIRTKYEYMMESFLKEANIPYHLNQVFCFTCNKFYPFESREMPSQCHYCKISFKGLEKGNISRPDFILDFNDKINLKVDLKKIGILRVDGAVHDRIKATRISDYHILNSFRERGIKVFVIRNETILEKSVKELRDICEEIKLMMISDELYEKYIKTNEFLELTYCPDIESKRRKRF